MNNRIGFRIDFVFIFSAHASNFFTKHTIMTEVHPNVHVCGEKEARELLLHLPRRNDDDDDDDDEKKIPLFSRVVAIGFPSAPLTEEEMTLLVRFRFSIFPFSGEKFVAIFFRAHAKLFFQTLTKSFLHRHHHHRADERENRRPSRFSRRLGRRRFALGSPRDDAVFSFFVFFDFSERCS